MLMLWPVFVTVFLAELGDKTQLATLLFAADQRASTVAMFAPSSAALMLSSLMAVLVGAQLSVRLAADAESRGRSGVRRNWYLNAVGCTIQLGCPSHDQSVGHD